MTRSKSKLSKDELHFKRMWHYMHNGLFGCVAMAKQMSRRVIDSPSATDKSKELAATIAPLLHELYESLKTRKPYNGDHS